MNEARFLSRAEAKFLHKRSLERYGGADGIRDEGGFQSALDQPKNTFFYGRGDLFDIAAAHAFHIAQGQCFIDGNKRTGMACAMNFPKANGVTTVYGEFELYDAMIGIAEHRLEKSDLAALLRQQSEPK